MKPAILKEATNPLAKPAGQNTAANLRYWSSRATECSAIAPRARGGEIKLPESGPVQLFSTGGPIKLPPT